MSTRWWCWGAHRWSRGLHSRHYYFVDCSSVGSDAYAESRHAAQAASRALRIVVLANWTANSSETCDKIENLNISSPKTKKIFYFYHHNHIIYVFSCHYHRARAARNCCSCWWCNPDRSLRLSLASSRPSCRRVWRDDGACEQCPPAPKSPRWTRHNSCSLLSRDYARPRLYRRAQLSPPPSSLSTI